MDSFKVKNHLYNMIKKILENYYIKRYKKLGISLGDNLSYSYMGQFLGYHSQKLKFLSLQEKIISYGYQPISLNSFISVGGYGHAPELLILHKNTDVEKTRQLKEENDQILKECEQLMQFDLANKI